MATKTETINSLDGFLVIFQDNVREVLVAPNKATAFNVALANRRLATNDPTFSMLARVIKVTIPNLLPNLEA